MPLVAGFLIKSPDCGVWFSKRGKIVHVKVQKNCPRLGFDRGLSLAGAASITAPAVAQTAAPAATAEVKADAAPAAAAPWLPPPPSLLLNPPTTPTAWPPCGKALTPLPRAC